MTLDIDAIDNFCGAGGSTAGLKAAGILVRHAANHWDRAIESHNTNHPEVSHSCVDLHIEHPARFPRTAIGWFSIECTTHSPAGGRKRKNQNQLHLWEQKAPDPSIERSRMGAWDVVRFTEYHRYEVILVENVIEFLEWELFDVWIQAMHKLGYEHQCVYFNSMFGFPVPVPQSRDRIYIVFHKPTNKKPNVNFTPPAFCLNCGKDVAAVQTWRNPNKRHGKYGQRNQYIYSCPCCKQEVMPYRRPAREAIDWTLPCPKIKDRKRPLSEATLRRIEKGLRRFMAPYLVHNAHTKDEGRVYSVELPSPCQTTRQEMSLAIPPFFLHNGHWTDERSRAYPVDQPSPTVTTWRTKSLIVPPFIDVQRSHSRGYSIDEPVPTVTAQGTHHAIVQPPHFIAPGRTDNMPTSVDEPTRTLTASNQQWLVEPPPFLTAYHGGRDAVQSVDQPSWTIATNNQYGVVQPEPFLSSYYGNGGESPTSQPSPTIRTTQGHALIEPDWSLLVEECGYRMLKPHEAKLLMGFPVDYIILGNQEEQFKQAGNAVTPIVAEMLGRAVVESLT